MQVGEAVARLVQRVAGAHDAALCWLQGSEGWLDAGGACAAFVDRSQAPPEVDDPESHGLITSRTGAVPPPEN